MENLKQFSFSNHIVCVIPSLIQVLMSRTEQEQNVRPMLDLLASWKSWVEFDNLILLCSGASSWKVTVSIIRWQEWNTVLTMNSLCCLQRLYCAFISWAHSFLAHQKHPGFFFLVCLKSGGCCSILGINGLISDYKIFIVKTYVDNSSMLLT